MSLQVTFLSIFPMVSIISVELYRYSYHFSIYIDSFEFEDLK